MDDDLALHERPVHEIHQKSLSGKDLGRILALTDGVFAFAITLLVIQLIIPVCPMGVDCNEGWLAGRLANEHTVFLAYVFTFFMIGTWWVRHLATFRYIERYDAGIIWLNVVFLLTIAVEPFILGVFAAYSSVEVAVVLFGAVQAAASALLLAVWEHATRAKLVSPDTDRQVNRYYELRGVVLTSIFLASVGIAFVSLTAAEVTWVIALAVSIYLRRV